MFNYLAQLDWHGFFYDAQVVICLILVICGSLLALIVGRDLPRYLKTKDGKGVAYGFVGAPLVIFVLALLIFLIPTPSRAATSEAVYEPKASAYSLTQSEVSKALDSTGTRWRIPGRFFTRGYVFLGLDYTKKISPMCDAGFYNDRLTSNMGAGVVLWQVTPRASLHLVYTHHSCAINPDAKSYDAIGARIHWDIYNAY